MEQAMEAVKKGFSVKRAAEVHKVPRTTLQDRVLGKVIHGTRPGPQPYLNKEEEGDLAEFIEVVADVGFGKTRKQVKAMVEQVAKDKGTLRKSKISDGWYRRFVERQPQLCLRKGDRTAMIRLDAMNNQSALDSYFMLLKDVLEKNSLMDKPGQIFNMDESGIPLDHRSPYVLTRRGTKKVRYCSSGNKGQVTVVGCINAMGQALPPFVVFDAKNLNIQWTDNEVPGTTYGLSDSGWMDMVLFKEWLLKHFLRHAGANRPLLLLLDGHSSHYNLEAINLAKENNVIMFTLVPHTTHAMQPLDTAVYGPLKTHWQDVCHVYLQKHPGRVITKYNFNEVFSKAWLKSLSPENIISGFKVCGIFPFNPREILDHDPCAVSSRTAGSVERCQEEDSDPHESFTDKEQQLYERRYEEGFNLYDAKYIAWLKINHPDADLTTSLLDHFTDVSVLDPVPVVEESVLPPNSDSTEVDDPIQSDINEANPTETQKSGLPPEQVTVGTSTAISPIVSKETETPCNRLTPKANLMSKYLVQYIPTQPQRKKAAETRVTGLRVLTSSEGITMLNEKEEKKRKEREEKEKRKQERLEKKKQKDLAKKKVNQKVNQGPAKRQNSSRRKKQTIDINNVSASSDVVLVVDQVIDDDSETGQVSGTNGETGQVTANDGETDDYECSECLGTYQQDVQAGNGAAWVKCGCGQWIHDECVYQSVTGEDGKERMCCNCVV